MIVDASALLAIVFDEDDARAFIHALAGVTAPKMSAVNFLEAAVRVDAVKDTETTAIFDRILAASRIAIVPVTAAQAHLARQAYRGYGKGNHEARLNFGDCFAYALARETGEPLLYKGGDFARTDIASAL